MSAATVSPLVWFRRGLLLVLGLAAALVLHEVAGRLVLGDNWTPEDGLSANALRRTPSGLHATRPDLDRATFANFSDRTPLHTDGIGLRVPGPEWPRPGAAREEILVIGASNTWGMGVAAEESWPFLFERAMADGDWPVRVHNASAVGYTLPQMLTRAQELSEGEHYDRILIVTPGSGLYMFGLGSRGDSWRFAGLQPWQVDLFALEYPFDERPELEELNGWLLRRDRPGRGGPLDFLLTESLVGHRLLVKAIQNRDRLRRVPAARDPDLDRLLGIAGAVGQGWRDLEDRFFARGIGFHHVFVPAEWRDGELAHDDLQRRVVAAFQGPAQVGKRYFPRLDLAGDPNYRVELENRPGADFLPDGRHLSRRGHAKVAAIVGRWYRERILPGLRQSPR
ncbi:MAG: hypothetical protein H6807_10805 [Planctomycetes bacterium]|nr:hypothetical protein [Planctomycetota bacterium]